MVRRVMDFPEGFSKNVCQMHPNSDVQLRNWFLTTVRSWGTRPQAARTLQVHVFELGPKKFELNDIHVVKTLSSMIFLIILLSLY